MLFQVVLQGIPECKNWVCTALLMPSPLGTPGVCDEAGACVGYSCNIISWACRVFIVYMAVCVMILLCIESTLVCSADDKWHTLQAFSLS